ncbi:uncharacterized protein [Typha latifolia]|uniref:uncharacterized protein n=1 Tax=Typha latifolia TaxID=4733 RepID=UPI003C2B8292
MATSFERWEKDPFFSAAEEVQGSADRMESVYRRWVQERKGAVESEFASGELRRELQMALGTAKWQLEELLRAINSSDEALSVGEDTWARHDQFLTAISSQIMTVENSLKVSNIEEGEVGLSWVKLDEDERDELALFLSCQLPERDISSNGNLDIGEKVGNQNKEASIDFVKNSRQSTELSSWDMREERLKGHRRVASAGADIGSWNISIPSEGEDTSERSSDDCPNMALPKILSYSALNGALESKPRMKWYRNGLRKWKGCNQNDAEESIPLRNHQLSQGINECFERSKSCLSSSREETYNKKIYGWVGVLQRQIQRSQYRIQYGHSLKIILLVTLSVLFIVMLALKANW